jgi:exonuclease VII small subunit
LDISDEKSLEKENITLEYSTKEFNDIVQNITHLKEKIENEIIKINNLYEKTIDELINKARKRYKRKITK